VQNWIEMNCVLNANAKKVTYLVEFSETEQGPLEKSIKVAWMLPKCRINSQLGQTFTGGYHGHEN